MKITAGVLATWLASSLILQADQRGAPGPAQSNQLAAAGSKIELPGLVIHGGPKKFVVAAGAQSLTNGILEFIAVEPGGRGYESLVTLKCKPSALQFALLLLGCESGALPRLAKAGEVMADRLDIELAWQHDGKTHRVPVETLLTARKTNATPKNLEWYFTGSYFGKSVLTDGEIFMADSEQAHICLWWSRSILINLGGDYGNPYQNDDEGFTVNPRIAPPAATPIQLIIRKHE